MSAKPRGELRMRKIVEVVSGYKATIYKIGNIKQIEWNHGKISFLYNNLTETFDSVDINEFCDFVKLLRQSLQVLHSQELLIVNPPDELKFEDEMEIEMNNLMERFKDGIDGVEEELMKEIEELEKENILALMDQRQIDFSEALKQVIDEVGFFGDMLNVYALQLNSMGKEIKKIETTNRKLQIQSKNQTKLVKELESLLNSIFLPNKVINILQNEKFSLKKIHKIEAAAKQLFDILQTQFDSDVRSLRAVSERVEQFIHISDSFNLRFQEYLKHLFREQIEEEKAKPPSKGSMKLTMHSAMHEILQKFKNLLAMLKETGPSLHTDLLSYYQSEYGPLYQKELKIIVEVSKRHLGKRPKEEMFTFTGLLESQGLLNFSKKINLNDSTASTEEFTALGFLGPDDKVMPHVLLDLLVNSLIPVIFSEREICIETFFNETDEQDTKIRRRCRIFLEGMFEDTDSELCSLIDQCVKFDSSCCVELFSALDNKLPDYRFDYLEALFEKLQSKIISCLDEFFDDQVKAISELKSSKKKEDIFPFVKMYPLFVRKVEKYARPPTRQCIDYGYQKVGQAIWDTLSQIAKNEDPLQANLFMIGIID